VFTIFPVKKCFETARRWLALEMVIENLEHGFEIMGKQTDTD
jgi:hypothetical protein